MKETIKVKLSPRLAEEVYVHTVETGLTDHRSGNTYVGLSDADISLYEKIEKDSQNLELDLAEAASLYDELYNLVDFFDEWAEWEGVFWLSVKRSASRHMARLREFGVQINDRGWAVKPEVSV